MATIAIWFLQTFDFHLNAVADSKDSMLAVVSGFVSPLFAPLGFGDWRVSAALVTGFIAKESVVATLTVMLGSTENLLALLSPLSTAALLAFCLLYTPCVAAVAAIRRELGGRWAAGIVVGQCVVAWLCAYVVRLAGALLGWA